MELMLPKIIAHRGAPKVAPENTLASFKKAAELGASWVECDVQLTQDEVPVIIHDFTLSRTTNGKGKVSQMSYRDLKKLDAGAWFSDEYVGEHIPTLKALLECCKEYRLGVNIELKSADGREKQLAEIVLEQLKQQSFDRSKVLISSFNHDVLDVVRTYDIDIALGFNCDYWNLKFISHAKKLECFTIHIDQKDITPTVIEECKSNFLEVLAYTVNDKERAKTLLKYGVCAMFSDVLWRA